MNRNSASGPRFLIWGISFGKGCRALAPLWLNSIFQTGCWQHDVVLLGDHHVLSLSHPQLTAVNVVPDLESRYSFPSQEWRPSVCHNWKPQIQFYSDLTNYDYVLYMDLDVLVNTNKLEKLLISKADKGKICVQKDIIPISADKFFTGRGTLTAAEKVRWADHAICAGIIGFPINEVGLRFVQQWHETNQAGQFRKNDQSNLIALLLRYYDEHWEYLGDTVIARRSSPYQETLLHFSGGNHALFRDYYGMTLRLREPNVWKQRCFRLRRDFLSKPFTKGVRGTGEFLWKFNMTQRIGKFLWKFKLARKLGIFLWH
jgi:hypothetical protein